jgi:hypothetical protein
LPTFLPSGGGSLPSQKSIYEYLSIPGLLFSKANTMSSIF